MEYRKEIDGLRAIAVIPVILFHAGYENFSGGYVGVDIFFVISGYLITTIILSEKERGTFSLVNFYERRARRIIPVLFFIIAICIPFSWFFLLASDLKDFSQSLVAVSLFSSNILFWLETGYWGTENELKPLLHTWSLAVEEQYYVLFPVFLLLMWRFRKRWILGSFLVLASVSFFISEWAAYHMPVANFFLLFTRAWELAIGASIAFYFLYRKSTMRFLLSSRLIDEIASLIGLAMIIYAIFNYSKSTPFPGAYALVPTIGTGLIIIYASMNTFVGRLLSNRILVGIGLISYSLYLWHQPIFAFARHIVISDLTSVYFNALIALTFILSYLSWCYIEVPFRNKEKFSRFIIFSLTIIGSVIFMAIGFAGHYTNGFDNRRSSAGIPYSELEDRIQINYGLGMNCHGRVNLSDECRTAENPKILVWGDSYAMHLVQGILSSKNDASIIQMTRDICGPFFDVAPVSQKHPFEKAKQCLKFTGEVKKWIEKNNIQYIVMSSPFSQYLREGNELLYRNNTKHSNNFDSTFREFTKTLEFIKSMGIVPVVFSPPPNNGLNLGKCVARAEAFNINKDECNFSRNQIPKHQMTVYEFLEKIGETYKVIRLDEYLCNSNKCVVHINDKFIYRDAGHLSYEGSAIMGKQLNFYKLIMN